MTLDTRKGRILEAVVNEYVESAEPVGSEWLVAHYDFGCKSATLRSEMAEMSEHGYLVKPHTSSGRIPSDRGYRYFVDKLLAPYSVSSDQAGPLQIDQNSASTAVDEMVQSTCRMLSDMTQLPSVASPPVSTATLLRRLYLAPAGPRHVLLVMLLSSGHVEHRLIEVELAPSDVTLNQATNYMNACFSGLEINVLPSTALAVAPAELAGDQTLILRSHAALVAAARDLSEDRLFLEGTSHIMRQREFQDVLRIEQLLLVLERRSSLLQAFTQALNGNDVTVTIGCESSVAEMQECSLVSSRYFVGPRSMGFIGVIGPTRMPYGRTMAAVGLMASSLSTMLTRVCIE